MSVTVTSLSQSVPPRWMQLERFIRDPLLCSIARKHLASAGRFVVGDSLILAA